MVNKKSNKRGNDARKKSSSLISRDRLYGEVLILIPIILLGLISGFDIKIQSLDNEIDDILLDYESMWKNYDEFKTFYTRKALIASNLDLLKSMRIPIYFVFFR